MKTFLLFLLVSFQVYAQVDQEATPEARELYRKLTAVSLSLNHDQKILIGQQNAFTEGRGWRLGNESLGQPLKSDMQQVSGFHPAVLGIDFNEIGDWNRDLMGEHMREVHKLGGAVTLSWHMNALIDDGQKDNSAWDTTTKVVKHILPGGEKHDVLKGKLDLLADYLLSIKEIPVIFRPWHEHNYSWFWWGAKHCKRREYIKLWRFTVDYLKSKGVHNVLYAYSPNNIEDDYLDRYPGDRYVDILGVDHYFHNAAFDIGMFGPWPLSNYKNDVVWLCQEASARGKIPAITEFGQEGLTYDRFWTDYFGWPLERAGMEQITEDEEMPERGIAYILLWRNDIKDPKHFFGPFPGHALNDNFQLLLTKKIFKGL